MHPPFAGGYTVSCRYKDPQMRHIVLIITVLLPLALACDNRDGLLHPRDNPYDPGGENYIFRYTANAYQRNGRKPAADVVVRIFTADTSDDKAIMTDTTDAQGEFSIRGLQPGTYTLLAEKDSLVFRQDSLQVSLTYTTLRDDTLECPASLGGTIALQPWHDPRTVTVRLQGSGGRKVTVDSSGRFTVTGLSSGTWTLHISSSLSMYEPVSCSFAADECVHRETEDTIRLSYAGIPPVTGLRAVMDTLHGTVAVSWNATVFEDLMDYAVYRNGCIETTLSARPVLFTDDTIFQDSSWSDLETDCLRYRVAIRDIRMETGPISDGVDLSLRNRVKSIAACVSHSLFLKTDGTLWACGLNQYGQLGDGTTENRLQPVYVMSGVTGMAAGFYHSFFLTADGSLWGCGFNQTGQLGDGTTRNRLQPVRVMRDVKRAAAGFSHSLILKNDGSLFTCGDNSSGQLGIGSVENQPEPVFLMAAVKQVAAGYFASQVLTLDNTLSVFGENMLGQLGDSTHINRALPFVLADSVVDMSTGSGHSLFVRADGTLWACGSNSYGQLCNGDTGDQPVPAMVMEQVQCARAGGVHSLVLKTDGTLLACGNNYYGQLGDGTREDRLQSVEVMTGVMDISAGREYSLILKKDGSLWACGSNFYGQLGDGTIENRPAPVRIKLPLTVPE